MKESELVRELKEKNITICVATETKMKLKGTKELENYVMIYSGVNQNCRAQAGVAILVKDSWKNKIVSYNWINERIVTRLKIEDI